MIRQRIAYLGLLLAVLLFVGSCSKKTPTLNLLVWEGYADPSFVQTFEEENHCKVSASYMGSSDELVAKLRGGSTGNYDVISPSSDVASSIATAGLAAPLDLSKIPSYNQLSAQLTSLPLVRAKSQVYGVPFMWGPDPIIYDTTAFLQPPDSWNVLWDPKYKGKVSVWDDLSTVYMAAQVLGYRQARSITALQPERRATRSRKEKAAGVETERPQNVVHRRRADESFCEPRNRDCDGLAAQHRRSEKSWLPSGRDHSQRKYYGLDRSPDDHRRQRKQRTGT